MSLVGKDVEVSYAGTAATETDEISSDDEVHRPLSPESGAEALFMSGLRTTNISANALATELRKNSRPFRSNSTVATDDYASAYDNLDDLMNNNNIKESPPGISKEPIYEFEEEPKSTMSTPAATTSPADEGVKVDAASNVYGVAKNVWGWGKEQIVISTFLGITEAVAGKVVGIVGTDLEEIDHNITPQLTNFDNSVINPAINAIVGIVLNAAGKSENFVKPIVVSILKPIGLIKSKDSVAPELTNTPQPTAVN
ncbi:expressed unknown protein [Seminavis robusta]|uniref:Uncharacterized protein n=1 Tax=Seminavis robusta TaxID=568900 RepID=A0A9N8HCP7_9STRA|nr:expressed unknown protein [Seminavis robusta]|eukprot:Sro421_g139560.1 n/a (255) ;mRNA; f:40849-41613